MDGRNEMPQPGTAGATAEKFSTFQGGGPTVILARTARAVNPPTMTRQPDPVEIHRELAAWHRERATRWLDWAHLSPWHASKWRLHMDAAAEHDRLAADHARRRGERDEVTT